MTTGRASFLALGAIGAIGAIGVIAAFGLGVWIGPHLTGAAREPSQAIVEHATPIEIAEATPAPRPTSTRLTPPVVPATSADLQARLRPVLYQGTDMDIAAQGFRDGEHFATVAHAARNTEVPFVLLKHRVLAEGKSLAAAIRDSRPAIDAAAQADLAVAQARVDIATIKG